jgi:hypothetical protein
VERIQGLRCALRLGFCKSQRKAKRFKAKQSKAKKQHRSVTTDCTAQCSRSRSGSATGVTGPYRSPWQRRPKTCRTGQRCTRQHCQAKPGLSSPTRQNAMTSAALHCTLEECLFENRHTEPNLNFSMCEPNRTRTAREEVREKFGTNFGKSLQRSSRISLINYLSSRII